MAKANYYSPRLDQALISPLYHAAHSRRVPMTALASALLRDGLERLNGSGGEIESHVLREDPPPDPVQRQR